jgi:AcrR family transcriptional regulator
MTADAAAMTTSPRDPGRARRGRGRPRGGDAAETRERIIAAASDLFADTGFRGTSMVAVAEAAGISQSGLLHYFGSKEQLLADVLERRDIQDMAALDSHPVRGWDALDRLVALTEHNTGREPFVRLFTAMAGEAIDPDHPGHEWLRRHHAGALASVTTALHEAQADGRCDPGAPVERIARVMVAALDGLQIQWLMDPEGVDMAGDVAALVRTVRERWGR